MEHFRGFVDSKKAFDRVWHDGLRQVLEEYNIDNWQTQVIRSLYDEAISAVYINGKSEIYFERQYEHDKDVHYIQYILGKDDAEDFWHPTVVSANLWATALQLADDIDLCLEAVKKNSKLSERLKKTAAGYGIEISSDKSKIPVNNIKPRPSTNIWMNGKVLEN